MGLFKSWQIFMSDCATCGKNITDLPRPERKKYCNRKCWYKSRPELIIEKRSCAYCGKEVAIHTNQEASRKRSYCDMNCRKAHWHGENVPTWKGGSYIDGDGYRQVSKDGKKTPEHVLLAEKALGRRLVRGKEVVHHINGDKLDNRPCNLLICSNSYHARLHQAMSRQWQRENCNV